jgi:putative ABC transport system ATP-binding protein
LRSADDLLTTASTHVILATERLGRSVAGAKLISDITLQVRQGEVLAIVGPSGSGKTSFLRLLNRLDEPTSGTVYFESADYRQISPRELRRKIGMVTQRPVLFPGNVAENIRFGPRQVGEILPDHRVELTLSEVGLAGYEKRDVANLSGGEAQRVCLARALANAPHLLLLDEPTSALDEGAKMEIEKLVLKIVEQNRLTCIIVTHDVAQAARMADRVAVFELGRMVRIGSAQEVLHA